MENETSYQQIMNAGEEVARVLQSAVFQQAYADTLNEMTREMFDTQPGHTKTLEEIARKGRALSQVMGRFQFYLQQAQAHMKPKQNTDGPDEYQGFNQPQ